MAPVEPDLYLVLGVTPDATLEEIRAAWKRQLGFWHPDKGNRPEALQRTKVINRAYGVLSNPQTRAAYDRTWRPDSNVDWANSSRGTGARAGSESMEPAPRHGILQRTVDWYLRPFRHRGRPVKFWESATPRLISVVVVGVLIAKNYPALTGPVVLFLFIFSTAYSIAAGRR